MEKQRHLYILWMTSDPHTAQLLVMQYAHNSITRDWWDAVTVILWGSSAKLLAEDEGLQDRMRACVNVGVEFTVCGSTARQLGVRQELEALGVSSEGWGAKLTKLLQDGETVLTV